MDKNSNKKQSLLICLTLIVITFAVFYQVHNFAFVSFDDSEYVYKNPDIQAGITLQAVKWAFTTDCAANWHPLTWLSHMLDWQLFGSNAEGHHVVNLIFHIANTVLLFIVLKQMTGALWQSAFVAALFALHPLHVESVAWVSERKDVLSTFFWILTMWAYVRYARQPKTNSYLLVVLFFALGLLSKPMVVTLPFVLLLLDYWPLERFNTKRSLSLLIEKIPLFIMVLALSIITFIVQKEGGAMRPATEDYTIPVRLANASISYIQYIIKMIWPARLAFFYPHPGRNVSIPYAVISAVILLTVTILVLRFAGRRRYLVTGWFWYLGTLLPVIGLVQVGEQAMADRYSYITLTGLFIIIGWGLPEMLEKSPQRKTVLWVLSLIVLFVLGVCTYCQERYWKNTITLCEHALKVTKDNYTAHYCMTEALLEQGRIKEAIRHNSEAVRIKPRCVAALNGLGLTLYKAGRTDDAIYYYRKAIEINPRLVEIHLNLANALAAKGERAQAGEHLEESLRLEPDRAAVMNNLAWFLATGGKGEGYSPDRAIRLARRACELTNYKRPDLLDTLAAAYAAAGAFDKAVETAEKALELCQSLEQEAIKKEIESHLVLYKAGKPYIE
ncbi:MAG: tetratricopeptide repeat protein [Sedimentisphaerales bacterium]